MKATVEKNRGAVLILGLDKATAVFDDIEISATEQLVDKTTNRTQAALTRRAMLAAQTIHIPLITQGPGMVRCLLPDLAHTELKHMVFVNHRLLPTIGIQDI